jgi:type IV pilus assembly protein PilV
MTTKRRSAFDQRGFLLLEVLIAMLIFSIGVLGIVGLQASMTRAQTGSKFRADASILAQRLVGTMWSDVANINSYATANCSAYPRCSQWAADVAALLPNGTVDVDLSLAPVVTISITWQPSNEEQRRYTTTSALAANSAVTP